MAAEHGPFASARLLGLENTVRELGIAVGELGNSVRLLTENQQSLSTTTKSRIDEVSGTVLVFCENMSSHAQMFESHDENFTKIRSGCNKLADGYDNLEQQVADIKGEVLELKQ